MDMQQKKDFKKRVMNAINHALSDTPGFGIRRLIYTEGDWYLLVYPTNADRGECFTVRISEIH